jgi:hypothetical protein
VILSQVSTEEWNWCWQSESRVCEFMVAVRHVKTSQLSRYDVLSNEKGKYAATMWGCGAGGNSATSTDFVSNALLTTTTTGALPTPNARNRAVGRRSNNRELDVWIVVLSQSVSMRASA